MFVGRIYWRMYWKHAFKVAANKIQNVYDGARDFFGIIFIRTAISARAFAKLGPLVASVTIRRDK